MPSKPDLEKMKQMVDAKGGKMQSAKKSDTEPPQQERMPIPGYERVCELCPYKDLHIQSKNFMLQMQLNENLKKQLQAVTEQLEELKNKE